MRRREFISLVAGSAAWPLAARAQQPSGIRRIGVLTTYSESDPEAQARVGAFREGLQKLGWTEGCSGKLPFPRVRHCTRSALPRKDSHRTSLALLASRD